MSNRQETYDPLADHLGCLTDGLFLLGESIMFLKDSKCRPSDNVITGIQDVLYLCHELLNDFGISTEGSVYLIDEVVDEHIQNWID